MLQNYNDDIYIYYMQLNATENTCKPIFWLLYIFILTSLSAKNLTHSARIVVNLGQCGCVCRPRSRLKSSRASLCRLFQPKNEHHQPIGPLAGRSALPLAAALRTLHSNQNNPSWEQREFSDKFAISFASQGPGPFSGELPFAQKSPQD